MRRIKTAWTTAGLPRVAMLATVAIVAACAALLNPAALTAADLFTAAEKGDVPAIEAALAQDADAQLARTNADGYTPLMVAARFGKADAVTSLLAHKASVDTATADGWTALLVAAKYSQTKAAATLIAAHADVSRHGPDGNCAIHLALFNDNPDLARALVDAGARLNLSGADSRTPLYMAVEADDPDLKLIAAMLDKGAEPDLGCTQMAGGRRETGGRALAPLHRAILNNQFAIVKLLIDHGADPENLAFAARTGREVDLAGIPALALAVRMKQPKIALYLLDHGANPNAVPPDGLPPLSSAVRLANVEMTRALLEHKADPNRLDAEGNSPLTAISDLEARDTPPPPELADLLKKYGAKPAGLGSPTMKERVNQTAAIQNLKALATAQAQFIKKMDFYATNGADLNSHGTLIAADLKNAFELYLDNGDQKDFSPKAGYVFRMLQGDNDGPTSFRKNANDPTSGMNTWAAIARPAEPGVSGHFQYMISEAGTVYQHAEVPKDSPKYKKFLLDVCPNTQDEDEMKKLGWTLAH